jgi:hypothetical protein
MSGPTSGDESLVIENRALCPERSTTMLYDTAYIRAENEYHREQLRRAYRPLLTLRAAAALTRNRIKRSDSGSAA